MPHKTIDATFDIRTVEGNGSFEGYASVFEQLDSVKDRVTPGAFQKTLEDFRHKGRMPALLWQHDANEPIGTWREIFEDSVGLYVRGELFINDIPRARQAYKLLQENALTGLSIGFRTVQSDLDPSTGVRTLTEIDLLEISLVTFPALDQARVSTVKDVLRMGRLPNEREFEAFLRDAGFSRKQAKGVIAHGYKALSRREAEATPSYYHPSPPETQAHGLRHLAETLWRLST